MADQPSHVRDRIETRKAKTDERRGNAAEVWAKVGAERQAVDERTARLRAARLAKESEGTA